MDGKGATAPAEPSRSRVLAAGQETFYLLSGVWPLVTRRSFEAVTGKKADWWLVQSVGVLVTAIGATLTTAGAQGRVSPDLERLAAGAALGLAAIDVAHGVRGRISRIRLLDAAAELALVAAWLVVARREHQVARRSGAAR